MFVSVRFSNTPPLFILLPFPLRVPMSGGAPEDTEGSGRLPGGGRFPSEPDRRPDRACGLRADPSPPGRHGGD